MRLSYTECCRLLRLDPDQNHSSAAIRQSYLRQAKRVHPDRCPGDDAAKEKFQQLSCAYETVATCSTNGSREVETDPDEAIDIALYKELFEKLSVQASDFWENSTEARFLRTLWSSWRAHKQEQQEQQEQQGCAFTTASDNTSGSDTDSDAETPAGSSHGTSTDTQSSSDTEDHSSEPTPCPHAVPTSPHPIRITLRLPLHDVYHNVLHRVKYTRYNHSSSSSPATIGSTANTDTSSDHKGGSKCPATNDAHTEEEVAVLVPVACREFCCHRQGDQLVPDGVRGDVVFGIDTVMPDETYRIHPTRKVLQRLVRLDPEEVCYGVDGSRAVEVCGTEVPLCVPPRLYETWNGTPATEAGVDSNTCTGGLGLGHAHRFDAGHTIRVPGSGLMTCEGGYCENTSAEQHALVRDCLELVCVVHGSPKSVLST